MIYKSFDYIAELLKIISRDMCFISLQNKTQRKPTRRRGGRRGWNGEAIKMRKTTQKFAIHEKRRRLCVSHRMRDLI